MEKETLIAEILRICGIVSDPAVFDNDGGLIGYTVDTQQPNHDEALKSKNALIKAKELTQFGFEVILFNYGEYFYETKLEGFKDLIWETRQSNELSDLHFKE